MKIFFRVEEKNTKAGPYVGSGLDFVHKCLSGENHPTPFQTGLKFSQDDHFGFDSLAKMIRWFGSSIPVCQFLDEIDYVLSLYKVEENQMKTDKFQACAPTKFLTPFRQYSLSSVIKLIEKKQKR